MALNQEEYPDRMMEPPEPEPDPDFVELPIGKYGLARDRFLERHYPGKRSAMIVADELRFHLYEVDQRAREMAETIVSRMAEKDGVTEAMKETDPMRWVGLMNNYRQAADEFVMKEIVYQEY